MSFLSALQRLFQPAPPPVPAQVPAAPLETPARHLPRERSVQCMGQHGLHRMAYTEWGDPHNPHVVLCVHGLTRNGRDFDELARALADDYRVVCPDVVGRGRSDWLSEKADYGFPTYVNDMVTLIARLDVQTVHWVGTSMAASSACCWRARRIRRSRGWC